MSERERLIKLIDDFGDDVALCDVCNRPREDCEGCTNEQLAEYLLENGVMVPPVKVGDKVYRISFTRGTRMKYIQATTISRIAIDCDGLWLFCSCNPIAKCKFGELVFLTKKSAEKALKGGAE